MIGLILMIGIMADSHDNVPSIRQAVRLFQQAECQLVIHAGDIIAPFSAKSLEDLSCPVKAVFGNCDGEKEGLKRVFRSLGDIKEAPYVFTLDELKILITHLDTPVKSYAESGLYDVIIFGHTHRPEISQEQIALLINPGETGGWVTGKSTIALLDPKTLKPEVISL